MNDNDLHTQVSGLSGARVHLPRHQEMRRAQLLEQYQAQQAAGKSPAGSFAVRIKEGIFMKSTINKLGLGSAFAAVAIVAVVSVMMFTSQPSASAAAQVEKTKAAVQQMTSEEVRELSERFDQNLRQRLDEAQSASDLRFLSSEEFSATTQLDPSVKLAGINIKSYVAFTASGGEKVIIAVDEHDKPVILVSNSGSGWTAPGVPGANRPI